MALCRLLRFFHSKLLKLRLLGARFVHFSCWNKFEFLIREAKAHTGILYSCVFPTPHVSGDMSTYFWPYSILGIYT